MVLDVRTLEHKERHMQTRGLGLLFDEATRECMVKRINAAWLRSRANEEPIAAKDSEVRRVRYGRRAKILSVLYGYRRVPLK
jgi:hypothetical protein